MLTNLQERILLRFSEIPDKEAFYLTGGTALSAFFLKHRRSNGLDFFTNVEELILPFSQKLEESLKKEALKVERLRGFHSFMELSVSSENDSSVIHFALDSPFRFEQPSDLKEIPGVKIDSLIDIATNKVLALLGRAELRDFIDLYLLVKEHFSKTELIEKAAKKDPGFDLYWFGITMERVNNFADDSPDLYLLTRPCKMFNATDLNMYIQHSLSRRGMEENETIIS